MRTTNPNLGIKKNPQKKRKYRTHQVKPKKFIFKKIAKLRAKWSKKQKKVAITPRLMT